MSKQSVLLVAFLFLYHETSLANCASTTASEVAEFEELNSTNDVEETIESDAQGTSETEESDHSIDLNPITTSDNEIHETEQPVSTIVSKRTPAEESESVESGELIPTYISTVEKFLKGVLASMTLLNNVGGTVGGVLSKIPGFKKIEGGVGRFVGGFGDAMNIAPSQIQAVFPGTYWCGAGDAAPRPDDLGVFEKTDACCRDHDSCQVNIAAGIRRHRLLNNGLFTRSHCDCDGAFYQCLKNASTLISSKVGKTYFNLLRPQCFREDYPVKGCRKYESRIGFNRKCSEYDYDSSQEMTDQWFDNPSF